MKNLATNLSSYEIPQVILHMKYEKCLYVIVSSKAESRLFGIGN